MSEDPANFDTHHRPVLEAILGTAHRPEPPMSYPQAAGFLYAVAAAPEPVPETEWLTQVLGDGYPPGADDDETRRHVLQAVMALHDLASAQVRADAPALPPGCEPPIDPAAAFGPDGALGQWAEGLVTGHNWLGQQWAAVLDEDLERATNQAIASFAFFMNRKGARMVLGIDAAQDNDAPQSPTDAAAHGYLEGIGNSLSLYMTIASEIRDFGPGGAKSPLTGSSPREPYRRREPRIGRNEPCPCGSGRKYKRCCGAPA